MIPITSEQDKAQLREHAFNLLKQNDFQGLVILIEVLKDTNFESDLKEILSNIEAKNYYLKEASRFGSLDVVKYLIEHGANIHTLNNEALRWAVYLGHREVVKYLTQHGANIHIDDNYVLRWATENEYLDVIKCAIEHGADIHADNDSILRSAKNSGNIEIIEYLEEVLRNDRAHQ